MAHDRDAAEHERIAQVLADWANRDPAARDQLVPIVYEELRRLAHHYMRGERGGHMLQTTALVNEVYLRLAGIDALQWHDRVHFFAMTATLIATCGIYGLMAYAVTQRRREIGVRMALGATRNDVLRLVLARALRIVVAGLVVGLAGAVGVTRVLQRFLFGVTPTDPVAFTIVTLLLMAVGLMAAWLPARRASRIDPWAALRAE